MLYFDFSAAVTKTGVKKVIGIIYAIAFLWAMMPILGK
jgi:hypothetical protein